MILLVSKDLMMSSTVSASAKSCGKTCQVVSNFAAAEKSMHTNTVELVLIDLQANDLDFDLLKTTVQKDDRPKLIGYAQHVNVDVMQRGRDVGLDQVLTRGQLHGNVKAILDQTD